MKHLKILGLAAVAAMALTALVGVASASAAVEFHSSAASATLHGTQSNSHTFTVQGSTVTCTEAVFTGTGPASKNSPTQEVAPTYSGCTAFGFAGATVNSAGCKYKFYAAETKVDLKSCASGGVTVTVNVPFVAKCVVFVPNQEGITTTSFENTAKRLVLNNSTNASLTSNVTTSTGLCPLTVKNGVTSTYVGNTEINANAGAAELWVE
jgi:hypothetical protein